MKDRKEENAVKDVDLNRQEADRKFESNRQESDRKFESLGKKIDKLLYSLLGVFVVIAGLIIKFWNP